MAAKYNVISRRNPNDPQAPHKYYPSFVSSGRVTQRQYVDEMAKHSTLTTVDLMAVLEGFLKSIPIEIAQGNIVDLGDFGSFKLRIKSTGSETEEDVTESNIENVLVQFRPGKEFKKVLKTVEFEKA